ncbi:hypothetical protein BGW42_006108, partial [Actinomortierella wolfii]
RKTVVGLSKLRWRRCKGRCACSKGSSDDLDLEGAAQAMMNHHQLADSEVDTSEDEDDDHHGPTTTKTRHSTIEKQRRSMSSSSSSSVTLAGSPVTPSSRKYADEDTPTVDPPSKSCRFPPILLFAVPGAIYFFNNNLTFVLLSLMPAPTYVVLSNLKILTTGLFSYWFLHRHLSSKQWVSLGLLFLSTAISQIDLDKGISLAISIQAFLLMILFCSLSAAASVFSEYVMKDRFGDESIHLQNMKLYMFGILFNGITYLATPPPTETSQENSGFFSDMALIHLFVVMAYASLGLVTSAIIKFSGSITKVYASSMSMFFAALVGWLLFRDKLTVLFFVGCVGCCYALHLYNAPSSSSSSSTSSNSTSSASAGGLLTNFNNSSSSPSMVAVDRNAYASLAGAGEGEDDEDDYNENNGGRLEMVVTSHTNARLSSSLENSQARQ